MLPGIVSVPFACLYGEQSSHADMWRPEICGVPLSVLSRTFFDQKYSTIAIWHVLVLLLIDA